MSAGFLCPDYFVRPISNKHAEFCFIHLDGRHSVATPVGELQKTGPGGLYFEWVDLINLLLLMGK